jgi:hypothetical protein
MSAYQVEEKTYNRLLMGLRNLVITGKERGEYWDAVAAVDAYGTAINRVPIHLEHPAVTIAAILTEFVNRLQTQNARSVAYRYREESGTVNPIKLTLTSEHIKAEQLAKWLDCIAYQSCETDDWDESPENVLLEALVCSIAKMRMIRSTDYDQSSWG